MRAARVPRLNHTDVPEGQQTLHQVAGLKTRVDVYEGIVFRVVMQLKVERCCHPLQNTGQARAMRDKMDPGCTIATADLNLLLGRCHRRRQKRSRPKPDSEALPDDRTSAAEPAPQPRPWFIAVGTGLHDS